jgi:hypothetical protein
MNLCGGLGGRLTGGLLFGLARFSTDGQYANQTCCLCDWGFPFCSAARAAMALATEFPNITLWISLPLSRPLSAFGKRIPVSVYRDKVL